MIGTLQIRRSAWDTSRGFSDQFTNFIAKDGDVVAGSRDPFSLDIPNSGLGLDALKSFSVILVATLVNAAGAWVFNFSLDQPSPPTTPLSVPYFPVTPPILWAVGLGNYNSPSVQRQPSPVVVASASFDVISQTALTFEADVVSSGGGLSGIWILSLDGATVTSGMLANLPTNLASMITSYFSAPTLPPGASLSNITGSVSVLGFTGRSVMLSA